MLLSRLSFLSNDDDEREIISILTITKRLCPAGSLHDTHAPKSEFANDTYWSHRTCQRQQTSMFTSLLTVHQPSPAWVSLKSPDKLENHYNMLKHSWAHCYLRHGGYVFASICLSVCLFIGLPNKKLSWCWQTRVTRLEVSQGHQTWYHSIDCVWFPISVP